MDPTTGALTVVPSSPVLAGSNLESIVVHPSGNFVYLGDCCVSDVLAFSIDRTSGALTAVPGSPFAVPDPALVSVAVHPSGKYLYASTAHGVRAFAIDANTGVLTQIAGSPFPINSPGLLRKLTVDPTGAFVYVTDANDADFTFGDISGFTIDPSSGALTPVPGSPFATGDFPISVVATGKIQ